MDKNKKIDAQTKNLFSIVKQFFKQKDCLVSPTVSKKYQHLKVYFAPKSNFLRFSLKLKECELQQ